MRIIPLVESIVLGLCFLKHETNSVFYFIVDTEVCAVFSSWFTLVSRYVPSLSFYYISDSFHLLSCLPCLKYLPPVPSSSPCLTGPSALCAHIILSVSLSECLFALHVSPSVLFAPVVVSCFVSPFSFLDFLLLWIFATVR